MIIMTHDVPVQEDDDDDDDERLVAGTQHIDGAGSNGKYRYRGERGKIWVLCIHVFCIFCAGDLFSSALFKSENFSVFANLFSFRGEYLPPSVIKPSIHPSSLVSVVV